MARKTSSLLTLSVHAGSKGDSLYGGVVNPIYPSAAYNYEDTVRYPRYFNTPNHQALAEKIVALEEGEDGLVFSSGMAAIMTALFAMVNQGDHVLFQTDLYGGTHHAAVNALNRYGIAYTMADASDLKNFERAVQPNTRLIYIETPSNPLMKITDIEGVVRIARKKKVLTMIDNTFASPVNQRPFPLGIDIVAHSGTKYIGGHSDLCCGVVVSSRTLTEQIKQSALIFGGSLDAQTCWLAERSLKTIVLRVRQQNQNAMHIAQALQKEPRIENVFYPGLKSHPGHRIAKRQMPGGFGGMVSFEVKGNADRFMKRLALIKPAISLGGVESTATLPVKTSHAKLTPAERQAAGISNRLVRLSVGIEEATDLIDDIQQAL